VVGDPLTGHGPDAAAKFADAVVRAQRAIADDPDVGMEAAIEAVPAIAEDRDTARAVLVASIDAWKGDAATISGGIDEEVWASGYQTMLDLGFIDGSVPVRDMYTVHASTVN
jgi:ABC-type nitrate/sulfonate/bicarbonate transport system substrate-binding protein